jgi:hypothetical protein
MNSSGAHSPAAEARIGFICKPDHDVFRPLATRLEEAGATVEFFQSASVVDAAALERLSLLVNKKVEPSSFGLLARAERSGLATWNGYPTVLLGLRMVGYRALERAGFPVPPVSTEKPDQEYIAKSLADYHGQPPPERNGEGDIYQVFLDATPVDYKYYAVDTGSAIAVKVFRTTPKLDGDPRVRNRCDADPLVATRLRRLLRAVDAQALGVDCRKSRQQYYAVDVNPAMSFRNTAMENALYESLLSRVPPEKRDQLRINHDSAARPDMTSRS